MATDGIDISFLQDEDQLRRLWQQTEDLSKKKEIRARMYKLREQRLKEFYTTGEVFSDVQKATPQKSDLELVPCDSSDLIENSWVNSFSTTKAMTHADSIDDHGFMAMKSKEIRDSESPNREYQTHQRNRENDGKNYWKMESSSESYHAVGTDGQYEVTSQSHHRNLAGENGRITADSAFSTENKSLIDRNGDVKVLSSRVHDNTGRDVSHYVVKDSPQTIQNASHRHELQSSFDDINDGNTRSFDNFGDGHVVYKKSGSRQTESRTSTSSHVQRSSVQTEKWTSSSKSSSSNVTLSRSATGDCNSDSFGNRGTNEIILDNSDDANKKPASDPQSITDVCRRGVSEVKKTIIRGGKVITETTTYVNGKPIDGSFGEEDSFKKHSTTSPVETITIIRGGKLIKETVKSKKPEEEIGIKSHVNDSRRSSVESFTSTERISTERQMTGHSQTITSERLEQPEFSDSPHPYEQVEGSGTSPDSNFRNQGVPKTKTIIRGGKIIKEKVPSDIEYADKFSRHEATHSKKSQERLSSECTGRSEISNQKDQKKQKSVYESEDEYYSIREPDNEYQSKNYAPQKQQQSERRADSEQNKPNSFISTVQKEIASADRIQKNFTSNVKKTSTKTVTVIRGGKVIKETRVTEDGVSDHSDDKKNAGGARPSQSSESGKKKPYKEDEHPDRRSITQPPSDKAKSTIPEKSSNKENEYSHYEPENITMDGNVLVKTVTVIRAGKLIKETVPLSPEEVSVYKAKHDMHGTNKGKEKNLQTIPNEALHLSESKPIDRSINNISHTDDTKPRGHRESESTVRNKEEKEFRKTGWKQSSIEDKTITVIRGGKVMKETISVKDDATNFAQDRENHRTESEQEQQRPQNDADSLDGEPKILTDGRKEQIKLSNVNQNPKQEKNCKNEKASDDEYLSYPSAEDDQKPQPQKHFKVVTILRAGKLVKESVPLTDEEIREKTEKNKNINERKKQKPTKEPQKSNDSRTKSDSPEKMIDFPTAENQAPSHRNFEPEDQKTSNDFSRDVEPEKNSKKPKGKKQRKKSTEPEFPVREKVTQVRDSKIFNESIEDKQTEKSLQPKKCSEKHDAEVSESLHDHPNKNFVPKDVKKIKQPQTSSRPSKQEPEEIPDDDDEIVPQHQIKTVTVIRSGKLVKETVQLTDDKNHKNKEQKIEKIQEKKKKKNDVETEDIENYDQEPQPSKAGKNKPEQHKSSQPKENSKDVPKKQFSEKEKLTTNKTISVIRSGKIIKETISEKNDEFFNKSEIDMEPKGKFKTPSETDKPYDKQCTFMKATPEKEYRPASEERPLEDGIPDAYAQMPENLVKAHMPDKSEEQPVEKQEFPDDAMDKLRKMPFGDKRDEVNEFIYREKTGSKVYVNDHQFRQEEEFLSAEKSTGAMKYEKETRPTQQPKDLAITSSPDKYYFARKDDISHGEHSKPEEHGTENFGKTPKEQDNTLPRQKSPDYDKPYDEDDRKQEEFSSDKNEPGHIQPYVCYSSESDKISRDTYPERITPDDSNLRPKNERDKYMQRPDDGDNGRSLSPEEPEEVIQNRSPDKYVGKPANDEPNGTGQKLSREPSDKFIKKPYGRDINPDASEPIGCLRDEPQEKKDSRTRSPEKYYLSDNDYPGEHLRVPYDKINRESPFDELEYGLEDSQRMVKDTVEKTDSYIDEVYISHDKQDHELSYKRNESKQYKKRPEDRDTYVLSSKKMSTAPNTRSPEMKRKKHPEKPYEKSNDHIDDRIAKELNKQPNPETISMVPDKKLKDQDGLYPDKSYKKPEGLQDNKRSPQKSTTKPKHDQPNNYKKQPENLTKPKISDSDVKPKKFEDKTKITETNYLISKYDTNKISIDISPSHAQFASSLRAPPLVPESTEIPRRPLEDDYQPQKRNAFSKTLPTRQTVKPQEKDHGSKILNHYSHPLSERLKSPHGKNEPRHPGRGIHSEPYTGTKHSQKSISGEKATSTRLSDVIDRLTCETKSSKERRKFTSRSSKSNIKKRSGTPGISPSSSPEPTSRKDRNHKRTSNGSTSSTSSDQDSDINSQRSFEIQKYKEVNDLIEAEKNHSRQTQRLTEKNYEYSNNSDYQSLRKLSGDDSDSALPEVSHPELVDDGNFRKKPKAKSTKPENNETITKSGRDDVRRFGGPSSPQDKTPSRKSRIMDSPYYNRRDSTPTRRPISPARERSRSPTSRRKSSNHMSSSRSPSVSPRLSPDRKSRLLNGSPEREKFPRSKSPEKKKTPKSPVLNGTPIQTKKELTEYPSQRRFPAHQKPATESPIKGKTRISPRPENKIISTPKAPGTNKKPDSAKPTAKLPLDRKPSHKDIISSRKHPSKTTNGVQKQPMLAPSTIHQPQKTKSIAGVPSNTIPRSTKSPTKLGINEKRGLKQVVSDEEDYIVSRTKIETKNLINAEIQNDFKKRPTTRKNIIDFDWYQDAPPDEFLVDCSSASSQEKLPTSLDSCKKPSKSSSQPTGKTLPKNAVLSDSKQPKKTQLDSPKTFHPSDDKTSNVPKDTINHIRKEKDGRKSPKRRLDCSPASSSENDSAAEADFINGERNVHRIVSGKHTEDINLIQREQETNFTIVDATSEADVRGATGSVESPESSRESTRSPDSRQLNCILVNANDVEELRPRYADTISEPEDGGGEDFRRSEQRSGQRQNVTREEESKKTLRDMLVKTTLEKINKIPDFGELRDETDEVVNVSVAERVNKFMETALKPDSFQQSRPEDITLKGLDDTINEYVQNNEFAEDIYEVQQKEKKSVIKAKTMFETIASNMTVTGTAKRELIRQDDILNRPSVFQSKKLQDSKKAKKDDFDEPRTSSNRNRSPYDIASNKNFRTHQKDVPENRSTSPKRYDDKSNIGNRPDDFPHRYDESPEQRGNKPKSAGDKSPRKSEVSPDRYGNKPRRQSYSPERHSSPPRTAKQLPDRCSSPSKRYNVSSDNYEKSPSRQTNSGYRDASPKRSKESPSNKITPGRPDEVGTHSNKSKVLDDKKSPKKSREELVENKEYTRYPSQKRKSESPDSSRSPPRSSSRSSSPQRGMSKPSDKNITSTTCIATSPKDRPKNKAPTPDRYGSVPGSATKKQTETLPRQNGNILNAYPKRQTSPLHIGQKSKDRDHSPKRKSESPDRFASSPRYFSQRTDTRESFSSQKIKSTATVHVSPKGDGRRSEDFTAFPRRKSESPDSYVIYAKHKDQRQDDRAPRIADKDYGDSGHNIFTRTSPNRSTYSPEASPTHAKDRRPFDRFESPEKPPTKRSPSQEIADQVRRYGYPKKEVPTTTPLKSLSNQSPYSKPNLETTKPDTFKSMKPISSSVVDKYSYMDYDKKTTSDTYFQPLYSPERKFSEKYPKSGYGEAPKLNGYHTPQDTRTSPASDKPNKIPQNSTLKAPALLRKQSQSEIKKLSTTQYETITDDHEARPESPKNVNKSYIHTDNKFSKFGITLKKIPSGDTFLRKGRLDVGKKESELDRTYDLDVLQAMLERAKGYEERRLIRGQIRVVKNLIENNDLSESSPTKPRHDAHDSTRVMSQSPTKITGNGPLDKYSASYGTATTTQTKYCGISPEKFLAEDTTPERYTTRSTVTLTLSSKTDHSTKSRRSLEKAYPSIDSARPEFKSSTSDREHRGTLIDSETRKTLKRSESPKKSISAKESYSHAIGKSYNVSKTIKKTQTEHETKESDITDSIISSYGVGPTDEKGRPLFGLQALRRQKPKSEVEPEIIFPKELEPPPEIRDSSGRAFFGLKALRTPKKEWPSDSDEPESPTRRDVSQLDKRSQSSVHSSATSPLKIRNCESEEKLKEEIDSDEVGRLMGEPGQSLKDMIRKHERLMGEDREDGDRSENVTSYSTSTVIRSSAVRRPDGTISFKKNVVRGETTSKNNEEPQTRVTTEEYSYESPEREPADSDDDKSYRRRSVKSVTSRSSTNDSLSDKSRSSNISPVRGSRKSTSPDRKSPERHSSSSRSSLRAAANDYSVTCTKKRDETPRKSISDRLTQLSKKFSNDLLDSSRKPDVKDTSTESHFSSYTSRTSSSYHRSSIDGKHSPLIDSSKSGSDNDILDKRIPSSILDDELGFCRRSSTPIDDVKETLYRKFSGSEDADHNLPTFTRVGKAGAVKALSQKFQQAAADAETPKIVTSYPKAGLILRSTSFKQTNGELTTPDSPGLKQSTSMEVRVGSPTRSPLNSSVPDYSNDRKRRDSGRSWSPNHSDHNDKSSDPCERRFVTHTTTEITSQSGKSFLGNSAKVTGVQDIISRMRAADQETTADDTANDTEARALLNKFLGASVMMSGMEPLVKASGASSSTLVSQVERRRLLDSTMSAASKDFTAAGGSHRDFDNIEEIWDEKKLRQLLDACSDYEGRRKLRARLRTVMAEKSACEDIIAAAREDEDTKLSSDPGISIHHQGESLLPYLVEQLRTTLTLDPRPNSSPSSEEGITVPRVEDSGTESGEDLRVLAGLRDSICDESVTQTSETDVGLLTEVHDTLKKLQTTLDLGLANKKALDLETRNNLLELVTRLQASLKMTPENTKPSTDAPTPHKNRFTSRRLLRQNRHTIGVTKEELADARRLLEYNALGAATTTCSDVEPLNTSSISGPEPKLGDSNEVMPLVPYALVKQNSAGDVGINVVSKSFRPVQFNPAKSKAQALQIGNAVAKPYSASSEFQAPRNYFQNHGKTRDTLSCPLCPQADRLKSVSPVTDHVISQKEKKNTSIESDTKVKETPNGDYLNGTRPSTAVTCDTKALGNGEKVRLENASLGQGLFYSFLRNVHHKNTSGDVQDGLTQNSNVRSPEHENFDIRDATSETFNTDSEPQMHNLIHARTFVEKTHSPKIHLFTRSSSNDCGNNFVENEPKFVTPQRSNEVVIYKADDNKSLFKGDEQERRSSMESDVPSSCGDEGPNNDGDISSESDEDNWTIRPANVNYNKLDFTHPQRFTPTQVQAGANKKINFFTKGVDGFEVHGSTEKRVQEIQNGSRSECKPKIKSFEESQKVCKEQKEKDLDGKLRAVLTAQDALEKRRPSQSSFSRKSNRYLEPSHIDLGRHEEKGCKSKPTSGSCDHEGGLGGELMDASQTESEVSVSSTSTENSVCHAQKLLQMATSDPLGKYYNKSSKRSKMKRSNTIDIPQPLHFFEVECDSDDSEDERRTGMQNMATASHLPATYKTNTNVPPQLEPKTESDRRFIAILSKRSQPIVSSTIWRKDHSPGDNPSQQTPLSPYQWENRFSRIKTAFEKPPCDAGQPTKPKLNSYAMTTAKAFWKSADDSATVLKPKGEFYAAANGARLSRQGSKFLKKLFEQKNATEKPVKLPWTNEPHENVVVGSLTVCTQKPEKENKFFSEANHMLKPSTSGNKFHHAPMSAFKPVQKRQVGKMFTETFDPISVIPASPSKLNVSKQFSTNLNDSKSPNTPALPWIKDCGVSRGDISVNSTLAKFETRSNPFNQATLPSHLGSFSRTPVSPPRLLHKSPSQPSMIQSKIDSYTPTYPNIKVTQGGLLYRASEPDHQTPPSVREKARNFQTTFTSPTNAKSSTMHSELKNENFKPITTYSVDVAATSTVYNKNDESSIENKYSQLSDIETNASTPEEHIAISKVMGMANQQQAVTLKQKTHRRDEEDCDNRTSLAKNLSNAIQKLSSSTELTDQERCKRPSPVRGSYAGSTPPRSPLVPPKLPTGKVSPGSSSGLVSPISPRREGSGLSHFHSDSHALKNPKQSRSEEHSQKSMSRRTSSSESLVTATRSEEWRENGASVITSRLQIPYRVCNSASPPRDLSPREDYSSPDSHASPTSVQRSVSWHQLNEQSRAKRPQSLIIPNLPSLPAPQRKPSSLVKTKSSHALGFGCNQFEATMNRATLEMKQKTVAEYLSAKPQSSKSKQIQKSQGKRISLDLDDNLENVDEAFDALFNSVTGDTSGQTDGIKDTHDEPAAKFLTRSTSATSLEQTRNYAETAVTKKSDSGTSLNTRGSTKTSATYTSTTTSSTNKPISPFAKFQQLDRQNSSSAPSSPSAGKAPLFTFTDPKLCRSASGAKDRLLQWCQFKTKNYKNIQIENFSTSWSNGLAFCALIHHFRPDAFDYDSLSPKERRKNFELAFRVAEEQANIAPLLDVEDMVMMKKPDWKCVFTYVQSIYHRFRNEEI